MPFRPVLNTPLSPADRRPDREILTVMTLNAEFLWDGRGPEEGHERIKFPWRGNPVEAERHMARIAEIVVASDPDILILCEVENASALAIFIEKFLPRQGYRGYVFDGDDVDTGQDVALLTRIDPIEVGFYDEYGERGGVRKALTKNIFAKLRVGPLKLGVIGVHLVALPDKRDRKLEREAQAVAIKTLARKLRKGGYSPVVCGDFNDYDGQFDSLDASDHSPISHVLRIAREMDTKDLGDDLVNAVRFVPKVARYTCHRDRNDNGRVDRGDFVSGIDHILLAPELVARVRSVDIPKHDDTRMTTTHFPVVVRLGVD